MHRDIAMVVLNYALYLHMSVRQNMGYGLKIAGVPKAEINAKVEQVTRLLQREPLLDRKPRQLSGGQRQRVAMGHAIVREPAVVLFDEPLSNLDAKLRFQIRLEIHELQEALGITALYVTHDEVLAMTMVDRMIVMNGGIAEQIGTPLGVYERPPSPWFETRTPRKRPGRTFAGAQPIVFHASGMALHERTSRSSRRSRNATVRAF